MSYDLTNGISDFRITYNLSPMFYASYPDKGIRKIYGKTGKKAVFHLAVMRQHILDNGQEMRKLEPSNGWGTYEDAVHFLDRLITASVRDPEAVWQGD